MPVDVKLLVRAAVLERRSELEQLVRQAVDDEISAIAGEVVTAELDERTNGHAAAAPTPQVKLCRICGEREAERHRTVCGPCRREQKAARARERRDTAAEEPPHAGEDTGAAADT